uniref:Ubiquitin-like protease family profile domain-containing protein n=1 Tax=Kalanchoe fedtschenkoi TaxID=63787 RepID=A0A7N0T1Z3_KALFE
MGALAGHTRKRADDYFSNVHRATPTVPYSPNYDLSAGDRISKKRRLSCLKDALSVTPLKSSGLISSRISRYPAVPPPIRREIHAPRVHVKYGAATASSGACSSDEMGNVLSLRYYEAKVQALRTLKFVKEDVELKRDGEEDDEEKNRKEDDVVEVIDVEKEADKFELLDDMSVDEIGAVDNCLEGCSVVTDHPSFDAEPVLTEVPGSDSKLMASHEAFNRLNEVVNVEDAERMVESWSLNAQADVGSLTPVHKRLYESVQRRNPRLQALDFQINLEEKRLSFYQSSHPKKKAVEDVGSEDIVLLSDEEKVELEDALNEAFIPLTDEEEYEVRRALSVNRNKRLVSHQKSGIEITGEAIQCLRPRTWLNDEVINLYLELLKEREQREPQRFLKCHFFNTFFYKKLTKGEGSYDFKAVRRWTTLRKLGYSLADCDMIFVPIHLDVHWCMAVINKRDQKFQYLDSLSGKDPVALKRLAQYYVDEVKDKSGNNIDVSNWKQEFVAAPRQQNGYDCGVFMIKYADFCSRGLELLFSQEHMQYFRERTVKEILRLRAD